MAGGANAETEALAMFKIALVKFTEACNAGMGDAEADVQRMLMWLENEQVTHWTVQIRHRQDALMRAEEALRQKKLYKDSTGRVPSAVEEQKQVNLCKQKLEEAQQKLANTKRWAKQLQKESLLYKGGMQRFQTTVSSDVPSAIAHLGALIKQLEDYAAVKQAGGTPISPELAAYFGGPGAASMARGGAGAGGAGGPQYAALRGKSPSIAVRDATQTPALSPGKEILPGIPDHHRKAIGQIQAELAAPAAGDKVVVDKSASAGGGIVLERAKGASAGDSGWYVGPSGDNASPVLEAVSIADLLSIRPEWQQLLSLPAGHLVVLDDVGVVTILNERDENVFKLET
jgi:hypothetical protein